MVRSARKSEIYVLFPATPSCATIPPQNRCTDPGSALGFEACLRCLRVLASCGDPHFLSFCFMTPRAAHRVFELMLPSNKLLQKTDFSLIRPEQDKRKSEQIILRTFSVCIIAISNIEIVILNFIKILVKIMIRASDILHQVSAQWEAHGCLKEELKEASILVFFEKAFEPD